MPKVSIIIPVYNAEKYIATTVRSLQEQTLTDWEMILVDDCSKDGTSEVCKTLATEDSRITYVRQAENGGPAVARNVAIDMAQGEYLSFVDSDDTVEPNYLQRLVETADIHTADVVWCNYYEVTDGRKKCKQHHLLSNQILDNKEALSFFLTEKTGLGCLWNKIYRRSFIEQHVIRINPNRVHGEDWEFNMMVFRKRPVIVPIEDELYHYIRQNSNSVISSYRSMDYDTYVHSEKLKDELSEAEEIPFDRVASGSHFVYMMVTLCYSLMHSRLARSEQKDEYHRITKDEYWQQLLNAKQYTTSQLTAKQKLLFISMKWPSLSVWLFRNI